MGGSAFPWLSKAQEADAQAVYDCIIIGAGMAGLTAARELSRISIAGRRPRVLILEGSGRIGGRLFTDRSQVSDFGSSLELGAEYIHMDPGAAPIWNEIEQYKLRTNRYPKLRRGYLYNSEYLANTPHSPYYSVEHLNFKILHAAGIFKDISNYSGPDISASKFIELKGYKGFAAEAADVLLAGHLGVPAEKISLKAFQADHYISQLKGAHEYSVVGGYDSILRAMIDEIPRQSLLFDHPVQQVRRGPQDTIQAKVVGGPCLSARAMLCTASIGMLQSRALDFGEFWTPEKEQALRFIKSSPSVKLSIRFQRRFWNEDMFMLNQLQKSKRKAGETYFVPHYKENDQPFILTALIGGDAAQRLWTRSPQEILQRVCQDLDEMFKLPISVASLIARRQDGTAIYSCKNWSEDPFAKGGTSNVQVNNEFPDFPALQARSLLASAENTKPLFWAGEATSLIEQPSSVHGAHSTGLRAAKEIHAYLANSSF